MAAARIQAADPALGPAIVTSSVSVQWKLGACEVRHVREGDCSAGDIDGDMLRPFELPQTLGDIRPLMTAWRFLQPLLRRDQPDICLLL